jgi:hypothetical protein
MQGVSLGAHASSCVYNRVCHQAITRLGIPCHLGIVLVWTGRAIIVGEIQRIRNNETSTTLEMEKTAPAWLIPIG